MSELLASYWRLPNKSGHKTKTAYLDLFDNGISANIVLFVDRFKIQLPKWVMRDFLSLGAIIYPNSPLNRRENPERVLVEDEMKYRLATAGFQYDPGRTYTYLPDARTNPDTVFEHASSRADLARAGSPNDMLKMILTDIADVEHSGADLSKVRDDFGWNMFEVVMSRAIRAAQWEKNVLRERVKELEAEQSSTG